jgi:hypothetical protein
MEVAVFNDGDPAAILRRTQEISHGNQSKDCSQKRSSGLIGRKKRLLQVVRLYASMGGYRTYTVVTSSRFIVRF